MSKKLYFTGKFIKRCETKDECEECTICFEFMTKNTVVGKLSCGHYFHFHCVDRWIRLTPSCPVCRKKMC